MTPEGFGGGFKRPADGEAASPRKKKQKISQNAQSPKSPVSPGQVSPKTGKPHDSGLCCFNNGAHKPFSRAKDRSLDQLAFDGLHPRSQFPVHIERKA